MRFRTFVARRKRKRITPFLCKLLAANILTNFTYVLWDEVSIFAGICTSARSSCHFSHIFDKNRWRHEHSHIDCGTAVHQMMSSFGDCTFLHTPNMLVLASNTSHGCNSQILAVEKERLPWQNLCRGPWSTSSLKVIPVPPSKNPWQTFIMSFFLGGSRPVDIISNYLIIYSN